MSSTQELFLSILSVKRPKLVLDVGSRDGEQALRFRRRVPQATVVALEANRSNYEQMRQDAGLSSASIQVHHLAATDHNGPVTFYELEQSDQQPWAKGASSLYQRGADIDTGLAQVPVQVEGVRLDTFVEKLGVDGAIALWIDVEGAAATVLSGLGGVRHRVVALHVELEPEALWKGQRTESDVLYELERLGFGVVARSPEWVNQNNVLLVNRRRVGRVSLLLAKVVLPRAVALRTGGLRVMRRARMR